MKVELTKYGKGIDIIHGENHILEFDNEEEFQKWLNKNNFIYSGPNLWIHMFTGSFCSKMIGA